MEDCEVCKKGKRQVAADYLAETQMHKWMLLCRECFTRLGIGRPVSLDLYSFQRQQRKQNLTRAAPERPI